MTIPALSDIIRTSSSVSAFAAGGGGPWTLKSKLNDEVRNSTTTLTVDGTISFTMLASTRYHFRAVIFTTGDANPDFKYRVTGPASPDRVIIHQRHVVPAGTAYAGVLVHQTYPVSATTITSTSGGQGIILLDGYIFNGTNAGDFQFQWAQNTSDATNSIVRAGSYIEYREVA